MADITPRPPAPTPSPPAPSRAAAGHRDRPSARGRPDRQGTRPPRYLPCPEPSGQYRRHSESSPGHGRTNRRTQRPTLHRAHAGSRRAPATSAGPARVTPGRQPKDGPDRHPAGPRCDHAGHGRAGHRPGEDHDSGPGGHGPAGQRQGRRTPCAPRPGTTDDPDRPAQGHTVLPTRPAPRRTPPPDTSNTPRAGHITTTSTHQPHHAHQQPHTRPTAPKTTPTPGREPQGHSRPPHLPERARTPCSRAGMPNTPAADRDLHVWAARR
ncbi:hypothetical protein SRB17_90080 [Streptomyces sp. RB17]|nr:hypothetical protein [Streptomyces sp. RB17]